MAQLLPGQVTLAEIRWKARDRADQLLGGAPIVPTYPDPYAGSRNPTPIANTYINESAGELYELMVNQYSAYWQFAQWAFTTTAGLSEFYPVPLDQLKILSLEWRQSPGNNILNVLLPRMNLRERNAYNLNGFVSPVLSLGNCAYETVGQNLWMKPAPQAGLEFQVTYVPKPLPLTDQGTITMNSVTAGAVLTFTLDGTTSTFTAIAHGGSPTSAQFVIGGTGTNLGDAGTAQSLAATMNAALGGKAGVINCVATPSSGATTGTSTVTVLLVGPATVTWSASSTQLVLSPSASTGPIANGPVTFSNIFQAYAGLDEYMVVDAAIKMGIKDKDTIAELGQAKLALVQRYKENYQVRNPGQPRTMTNVRRSQWWDLPGWGR